MNFIIIIICSIILPIISVKVIKPKICINCKYFIQGNGNTEYGKCLLFPRKEREIKFLVNGVNDINKDDYTYCSIARDNYSNMCGEEGKMYKKKYIKNNTINNTIDNTKNPK